eukprot:2219239-Prymnesium_polylepis.1
MRLGRRQSLVVVRMTSARMRWLPFVHVAAGDEQRAGWTIRKSTAPMGGTRRSVKHKVQARSLSPSVRVCHHSSCRSGDMGSPSPQASELLPSVLCDLNGPTNGAVREGSELPPLRAVAAADHVRRDERDSGVSNDGSFRV